MKIVLLFLILTITMSIPNYQLLESCLDQCNTVYIEDGCSENICDQDAQKVNSCIAQEDYCQQWTQYLNSNPDKYDFPDSDIFKTCLNGCFVGFSSNQYKNLAICHSECADVPLIGSSDLSYKTYSEMQSCLVQCQQADNCYQYCDYNKVLPNYNSQLEEEVNVLFNPSYFSDQRQYFLDVLEETQNKVICEQRLNCFQKYASVCLDYIFDQQENNIKSECKTVFDKIQYHVQNNLMDEFITLQDHSIFNSCWNFCLQEIDSDSDIEEVKNTVQSVIECNKGCSGDPIRQFTFTASQDSYLKFNIQLLVVLIICLTILLLF